MRCGEGTFSTGKEIETVSTRRIKPLAVIGGSAVITAAALAGAILQGPSGSRAVAGRGAGTSRLVGGDCVVASTATGGERAFDERAVVNAHGVRRGGAAIGDAVQHGGARFWRRRHQRGRGHRFEWWSCPRLVASGGLRRL